MWENTKLDTLKSCFKQGSTPLIVRTRAKKWVNHWIITLQLIPLVGACQSFFKNKVTATTAIRKLPTWRSCSHQVIPKLQSVRSEPHERHCFMVLRITYFTDLLWREHFVWNFGGIAYEPLVIVPMMLVWTSWSWVGIFSYNKTNAVVVQLKTSQDALLTVSVCTWANLIVDLNSTSSRHERM